MNEFQIITRQEYDYCVSRGIEPLIDPRFPMDHSLRVLIQKEKFGEGHTPAENERFYRFCWKIYPHHCEECLKPLNEFSATYVSHILSRGAHPEMAHDPRNINILCFDHHNRWEHATTRKDMRIYRSNVERVRKLKKEYETNQF